ncbi:MAG: hypothetical protein GY698_13885 [Actinomycetia bacterium]|nr:hypothetical protein [Actinomycetes bacterium]
MLLSDIAEEYALTKLAALDACALGGLRIRSFHAELTEGQVERLRWVLGPTAPPESPAAAPVAASTSSLLSRWDEATNGTNTISIATPPPPPAEPPPFQPVDAGIDTEPDEPFFDEDDHDALDPAHLAALALVEAEEETFDPAALAAELRRLADEPEDALPEDANLTPIGPQPELEPDLEASDAFPDADNLKPVAEPDPVNRDLPRHPFKPLSFEEVVADLAVQLRDEDEREPEPPDAITEPMPEPLASTSPPSVDPPPLQPVAQAPSAPQPPPTLAPPAPQPAGRSHVAPPTGGMRPRDLDIGGDAADAGALAFLDHRNVLQATPIPEDTTVERKMLGSVVMALWVAVLVGAVVLIVQLRGGGDDTTSADSQPIGENTVGTVRDVFDLSTGDCFTSPGIGSVQTAVVLPCAEPHTAEVYATVDYPTDDGLFPGDEDLHAFGDQACLDAFGQFIGVDYLVSGLDYYFVTPQESAWNEGGRRTVSCSVIEPDFRPVTGSLEGSTR